MKTKFSIVGCRPHQAWWIEAWAKARMHTNDSKKLGLMGLNEKATKAYFRVEGEDEPIVVEIEGHVRTKY